MRYRNAAFAALLLAAGLLTLGLPTPAKALPPAKLGVFSAQSYSTPIGTTLRVPAESAGGLVRSWTSVKLGKTQAQAAGVTLGPLGDAFVIASQPTPLFASFPSVINAQDPPSAGAPHDNSFAQSVDAGAVHGLRLHATASDAPTAVADATAVAADAAVISTGTSTSHSESRVLPDGTVTTTSTSSSQNVSIGPPGAPAVLTIASVSGLASVTIPPNGKPVTTLDVRIQGALLAGIPVTINQDGITVAGTVALPISSIVTVNNALALLAASGLTVVAVPTTRTATGQGATVSGAAIELRYQVPKTPTPLPTDIGTDETLLLSSVGATATARPLQPIQFPASPGAIGAPTSAMPDTTQPTLGGSTTPTFGSGSQQPQASVAGPTGLAQNAFRLPPRADTAASDQLIANYRLFLAAAALGLIGLHLTRRNRRSA